MDLSELEVRIEAYSKGISDSIDDNAVCCYAEGTIGAEEWRAGFRAGVDNDKKRNVRLRQMRLRAARIRGNHTSEEWCRLVAEFEGRCVRCWEKSGDLQKDHIIPIYQSGSHGIENVQPLCRKCNTAKGPETVNWVLLRRKQVTLEADDQEGSSKGRECGSKGALGQETRLANPRNFCGESARYSPQTC